jgi:ATP-binding cassette subfamily B protein
MYLELLKNIFKFLTILKFFRKKLFFLMLLTSITALFEIILISSIIPLFSTLFGHKSGNQNLFEKMILDFFPDNLFSNKLIIFSIIFAILAVTVGFLRTILLKYSLFLCAKVSSYSGEVLFKQTLYKPFSFHINANSSELISAITQKNNDISASVMSIILLFSNTILFFAIFFLLTYINSKLILIVSLAFLFSYLLIEFFSRKKLFSNSKLIAINQNDVIKSLQEGFGGIKEIILQNLQKFYVNLFTKSNSIIQNKIAENRYISQFPRFIIETLTLLIFAILIVSFQKKNLDIIEFLPLLTAIALGVQRLLPIMQQIYFNFVNIVSKKSALDDYLKIFFSDNQKNFDLEKKNKIKFSKNIIIQNLTFSFNNRNIFQNMSLDIKKGSNIGIIGQTGTGKTTFVNLLTGMVKPENGKILIDDIDLNKNNLQAWTSQITYVPQEIFLFDSTIAENIAIGERIEDIDFDRLNKVCKMAQILEVINKKKNRLYEIVGEKGIKLSAGERQRIGLARAFYRRTEILILDESTSAIDGATEKIIMKNIYDFSTNKTLIIIAHRTYTLSNCDQIFEISNLKFEDVTKNFI